MFQDFDQVFFFFFSCKNKFYDSINKLINLYKYYLSHSFINFHTIKQESFLMGDALTYIRKLQLVQQW